MNKFMINDYKSSPRSNSITLRVIQELKVSAHYQPQKRLNHSLEIKSKNKAWLKLRCPSHFYAFLSQGWCSTSRILISLSLKMTNNVSHPFQMSDYCGCYLTRYFHCLTYIGPASSRSIENDLRREVDIHFR